MARRSKNARKRSKQQQRDQMLDAVAQDTAARFTCSHEIAADFADQCFDATADLESDIAFNKLALELWSGFDGRARDLAIALEALQAERLRHLDALAELGDRFAALAEDESFHAHLDPVEPYQAYVRQRLFGDDSPALPLPSQPALLDRPSDSDVL